MTDGFHPYVLMYNLKERTNEAGGHSSCGAADAELCGDGALLCADTRFSITRRWDDVNIVFIDVGSTTIELIGRDDVTAGRVALTGGWDHLALHVESVDEAFQELIAKGVKIRSEPRFVNVRTAFFFDPDGNVLELVEDLRQA